MLECWISGGNLKEYHVMNWERYLHGMLMNSPIKAQVLLDVVSLLRRILSLIQFPLLHSF